jgi:hypothetical protein
VEETVRKVTLHVFPDGHGLVDLGPAIGPQEIELFHDEWQRAWGEAGAVAIGPGTIFIGGMEVEVVEHHLPIKDVSIIGGEVTYVWGKSGWEEKG